LAGSCGIRLAVCVTQVVFATDAFRLPDAVAACGPVLVHAAITRSEADIAAKRRYTMIGNLQM
jgi:hypothetical protein